MGMEYLKTLWMLRFEKIRKTEEDAAWVYQELLDRCQADFGRNERFIQLLKRLVDEERAHAKQALELIDICRENHVEYGLL